MRAHAFLSVLFVLGPLFAQGERLQRAILIEEQEHDLKKAAELYRQIAEARDTSKSDRTVAYYRLGKVLVRQGKEAAGREALARSAKGEGPTAEAAKALLKDEGQDRDKELREKARALLADQSTGGLWQKLRFIGPVAMPEIIKAFEAYRVRETTSRDSVSGRLAILIWELDGKQARSYLTSVLASKDATYRGAVAWGIGHGLNPKLLDLALRFMRDPELHPTVTMNVVCFIAKKAPLRELLLLTRSKHPEVARVTWQALQRTWAGELPDTNTMEARMRQVLPELRASLASKDATTSLAARTFVQNCGLRTKAGREFLLELLPTWPRTITPAPHSHPASTRIQEGDLRPPASLPAVLNAARKLGPFDSGDLRAQWLRDVCTDLSSYWERGNLTDVLELVRLGYFTHSRLRSSQRQRWGGWLRKHTKPNDAPTILNALADSPQLLEALAVVDGQPLPASSWPILLRCWRRQQSDRHAERLFSCMGYTGSKEALPFFLKELQKRKPLTQPCTRGLISLSMRKDTPEVREALRSVVTTAIASRKKDTASVRFAFERLLRLGDVKAGRLMPQLDGKEASGWVHALQDLWDPQSGQYRCKHGFDSAGLAEVWAHLLDQGDRYWQAGILLRAGKGPNGQFAGNPRPAVVEVILPKLKRILTDAVNTRAEVLQGQAIVLSTVLSHLPNWGFLGPGIESQIHDLTVQCLASGRDQLQMIALDSLFNRESLQKKERDLVLRLARGKNQQIADRACNVIPGRITLSQAEFVALLRESTSRNRSGMLGAYLVNPKENVALAIVLPFLQDKDQRVRITTCEYLGRRADANAVASLLRVLRDPADGVRKAAEQALRSIRFYHEQKAHWDRAFGDGTQINANSAAEALLKQANPKETKATRLLAIRSLGLLGKVETLPFLIEYTKEKDTDIAAAARTAIDTVQKKAALQIK